MIGKEKSRSVIIKKKGTKEENVTIKKKGGSNMELKNWGVLSLKQMQGRDFFSSL